MDEKQVKARFSQVIAETVGSITNEFTEFAIYPYGEQGEVALNVLNSRFNIQPKYIIDSKWSKYNSNIITLQEIQERDNENLIVFITSDNASIYDEIRIEIRNVIKKGKIIDLFYIVNEMNDRKIEALRLTAMEMNKIRIGGEVAEAGVREGAFARYINKYFNNKKIYLFDTFEGFTNDKVKNVMSESDSVFQANLDYRNYYHATKKMVEMPYPEKVVIKKGFFPETTEGINDKFCYVHIDMDIYQSTWDGLEYFWPRMVERGMIMIDDYNNDHCIGVKKAVDEFCDKNGIAICPLPEYRGTVVLLKNR